MLIVSRKIVVFKTVLPDSAQIDANVTLLLTSVPNGMSIWQSLSNSDRRALSIQVHFPQSEKHYESTVDALLIKHYFQKIRCIRFLLLLFNSEVKECGCLHHCISKW